MPGDDWQKFANLRAYYGFMWGHPGKKLLFMGQEFAQRAEWNHAAMLDWKALDDPKHAGMQALVRDLNHLYRDEPALYRHDTESRGFEWILSDEADTSIYAWVRRGDEGDAPIVVVCNFTPVLREEMRIGLPQAGTWREVLNTDAEGYGGSGAGNMGRVRANETPVQGQAASATITVPPLATVMLRLESA
jgi:1,4-alpha-glucan branching enzyme